MSPHHTMSSSSVWKARPTRSGIGGAPASGVEVTNLVDQRRLIPPTRGRTLAPLEPRGAAGVDDLNPSVFREATQPRAESPVEAFGSATEAHFAFALRRPALVSGEPP